MSVEGPVFGFLASIVTLWPVSSVARLALLANDGTWVSKLLLAVAELSLAG